MMVANWVKVILALAISTACIQPDARSETSSSADDGDQVRADEETEATQLAANVEMSEQEAKERQELPDVVEDAMPAVVGVMTEQKVSQPPRSRAPFGRRSPFGELFPEFKRRGPQPQPRDRTQEGIGSGVIVDSRGVVLTNNHVIEEADTIWVRLSDSRELRADVEGSDPESDIAVLRIEDPPDDLRAMPFGNSDELRLGESVVAIGNPFGLSGTVTLGIVSAKGRADVGIVDYENFIQTDAAINPGNSGGAMMNLDGELVGINTAILSGSGGYQGVGFAIPSNMAEIVTNDLLDDGRVNRGWLGVAIQELTPQLAGALGLDEDLEGVIVSDVQPNSPAAEFGLRRGDVITYLDGSAVQTPRELRNEIGLRSPDDVVDVKYIRDGATREVALELGSAGDSSGYATADGTGSAGPAAGIEGLELQPLDRTLREEFGVPSLIPGGLAVIGIEPNAEAAGLNLRQGDVILEVNRRPVTSVEEFAEIYDADRPQNLILIYRDGATIFMTQ